MAPTTRAVPMSGCLKISAAAVNDTTRTGRRALRTSPVRSSRRASRSAMKRMRASLASSEGWTRKLPKPSHRLRAAHADPDVGQQHGKQEEHHHPDGRHCQPPPDVVVDAHGHGHDAGPQGDPQQLLLEEDPRRAVVGQGLDRRGRQHHHQPDHHQGDGDGQDHQEAAGPPGGHRSPLCLPAPMSWRTARVKSSPRSAYELYQSNEAAGRGQQDHVPGGRRPRQRPPPAPSTPPKSRDAAPTTPLPPRGRPHRWPPPSAPGRHRRAAPSGRGPCCDRRL